MPKVNSKNKNKKVELIATKKELEYRKKFLKDIDINKYESQLKCTKCSKSIKNEIQNGNVLLHPLLSVFYCKKCIAFYEDGEFSSDEDGEDKYCRWCGEGGMIYLCAKCSCGFCGKCIRNNLGAKAAREAKEDDDWQCFICHSDSLWELRAIAEAAVKVSDENKSAKESKSLIIIA